VRKAIILLLCVCKRVCRHLLVMKLDSAAPLQNLHHYEKAVEKLTCAKSTLCSHLQNRRQIAPHRASMKATPYHYIQLNPFTSLNVTFVLSGSAEPHPYRPSQGMHEANTFPQSRFGRFSM
jgi:hypothetical protein